jgi:NADH:ubiquinone oxidoreductase subunit 6 (subunit J)
VTLESLAFWGLAALLVGSALAVVLTTNLFHAVLFLALALVGTAGIFLSLDAEFLAAVQLLLYAGGVVTIVVFAIVVTERLVGDRLSQTSRTVGSGVVVAGAVLVGLWLVIRQASLPAARPAGGTGDLTRAIGDAVLTRFLLPFELLAALFLVGLLGAIYFARPDD